MTEEDALRSEIVQLRKERNQAEHNEHKLAGKVEALEGEVKQLRKALAEARRSPQ